ncbi:hypothetical protein D9Q98_007355 [Chlorella vulgaris]|uniref:Uncharacterized protein n=1 Tax=Chlorella vulgaris TaxID=3077 RepID=A0A9D4YVF2_CHLVU|nr:hypothetical protein D9Q98_007355 [Chlorella vulgaris]
MAPPSSTDEQLMEVEAVAGAAAVEHSQLSGTKRKEAEPRKKPSFKALGHMVVAMRRFADSLNPTYTYGKRTSSGGGGKLVSEDSEAAVVTSGEKGLDRPPSKSGRPSSPDVPETKYAYGHRGHKFDFLIKPLPPTEDEEVA